MHAMAHEKHSRPPSGMYRAATPQAPVPLASPVHPVAASTRRRSCINGRATHALQPVVAKHCSRLPSPARHRTHMTKPSETSEAHIDVVDVSIPNSVGIVPDIELLPK